MHSGSLIFLHRKPGLLFFDGEYNGIWHENWQTDILLSLFELWCFVRCMFLLVVRLKSSADKECKRVNRVYTVIHLENIFNKMTLLHSNKFC